MYLLSFVNIIVCFKHRLIADNAKNNDDYRKNDN